MVMQSIFNSSALFSFSVMLFGISYVNERLYKAVLILVEVIPLCFHIQSRFL